MSEVPEMVERVARACFEAFRPVLDASGGGFTLPWENTPECGAKENWRGVARAAMEALRESTEAMVKDGGFVFPDNEDGYGPEGVWDAMIHAALNA